MNKKKLVILFYALFVLFGALSLIFIPNAMKYSGGSIIALFVIFLPLAYVLWTRFSPNLFIKITLALSLFALFIEYVGLKTGWPYGEFVYIGELGYKIGGILPWTISISWAPLVIGSVAMVYGITQKRILRIILPVVILVMFDLLLDPAAVGVGLWSYVNGGVFYGVPVSNFLGWALSGFVGSLICFFFINKYPQKNMRYLMYSFFISIVFWLIVSAGLGLWVPFFIGCALTVLSVMVYFKNNEKNFRNK
jgi:bisanhydrobacterioruberin hydratase